MDPGCEGMTSQGGQLRGWEISDVKRRNQPGRPISRMISLKCEIDTESGKSQIRDGYENEKSEG